MLQRLFFALLETNGAPIDLSLARQSYKDSNGGYRLYVGSGNNAQLVTQQAFKESRWWWTVGVQGVGAVAKAGAKDAAKEGTDPPEYNEEEEADEDEMQARATEKSAAAEDFREQNMIWTQWKKYSLFSQLKSNPTPQPSGTPKLARSADDKVGELTTGEWEQFFQGSEVTPAAAEDRKYVSSNDIRLYAKLENNHHLSNKCSLFYNMTRYYEALGRDPFEVIPLTFHIKKGCIPED